MTLDKSHESAAYEHALRCCLFPLLSSSTHSNNSLSINGKPTNETSLSTGIPINDVFEKLRLTEKENSYIFEETIILSKKTLNNFGKSLKTYLKDYPQKTLVDKVFLAVGAEFMQWIYKSPNLSTLNDLSLFIKLLASLTVKHIGNALVHSKFEKEQNHDQGLDEQLEEDDMQIRKDEDFVLDQVMKLFMSLIRSSESNSAIKLHSFISGNDYLKLYSSYKKNPLSISSTSSRQQPETQCYHNMYQVESTPANDSKHTEIKMKSTDWIRHIFNADKIKHDKMVSKLKRITHERYVYAELCMRQTLLIHDKYPEYPPEQFISQKGYMSWKQMETSLLKGLIHALVLRYPSVENKTILKIHPNLDFLPSNPRKSFFILAQKCYEVDFKHLHNFSLQNIKARLNQPPTENSKFSLSKPSIHILAECSLRWQISSYYKEISKLEALIQISNCCSSTSPLQIQNESGWVQLQTLLDQFKFTQNKMLASRQGGKSILLKRDYMDYVRIVLMMKPFLFQQIQHVLSLIMIYFYLEMNKSDGDVEIFDDCSLNQGLQVCLKILTLLWEDPVFQSNIIINQVNVNEEREEQSADLKFAVHNWIIQIVLKQYQNLVQDIKQKFETCQHPDGTDEKDLVHTQLKILKTIQQYLACLGRIFIQPVFGVSVRQLATQQLLKYMVLDMQSLQSDVIQLYQISEMWVLYDEVKHFLDQTKIVMAGSTELYDTESISYNKIDCNNTTSKTLNTQASKQDNEIEFDLENWFYPFLKKWIKVMDEKWSEWVDNMIKIDEFVSLDPTNEIFYSSSALDLFRVFHSGIDFVSKLEWKLNSFKKLQFLNLFVALLSKTLHQYCCLLLKKFCDWNELEEIELDFGGDYNDIIKYKNKETRNQGHEKLIVILNNILFCNSELPSILKLIGIFTNDKFSKGTDTVINIKRSGIASRRESHQGKSIFEVKIKYATNIKSKGPGKNQERPILYVNMNCGSVKSPDENNGSNATFQTKPVAHQLNRIVWNQKFSVEISPTKSDKNASLYFELKKQKATKSIFPLIANTILNNMKNEDSKTDCKDVVLGQCELFLGEPQFDDYLSHEIKMPLCCQSKSLVGTLYLKMRKVGELNQLSHSVKRINENMIDAFEEMLDYFVKRIVYAVDFTLETIWADLKSNRPCISPSIPSQSNQTTSQSIEKYGNNITSVFFTKVLSSLYPAHDLIPISSLNFDDEHELYDHMETKYFLVLLEYIQDEFNLICTNASFDLISVLFQLYPWVKDRMNKVVLNRMDSISSQWSVEEESKLQGTLLPLGLLVWDEILSNSMMMKFDYCLAESMKEEGERKLVGQKLQNNNNVNNDNAKWLKILKVSLELMKKFHYYYFMDEVKILQNRIYHRRHSSDYEEFELMLKRLFEKESLIYNQIMDKFLL